MMHRKARLISILVVISVLWAIRGPQEGAEELLLGLACWVGIYAAEAALKALLDLLFIAWLPVVSRYTQRGQELPHWLRRAIRWQRYVLGASSRVKLRVTRAWGLELRRRGIMTDTIRDSGSWYPGDGGS